MTHTQPRTSESVLFWIGQVHGFELRGSPSRERENAVLDFDQCPLSTRQEQLRLPYNRQIMSQKPSPIEPEFATAEEAEAYDHWFREKVQMSLDDQRPSASHDEVMAALRKIIEAKRDLDASDPMAN